MKNTKSFLLIAISAVALSSAPALRAQERHDQAQDRREDAKDRREDRADEHAREYHFRQEDGARLREHYKKIEHVDVAHRAALVTGARLPGDWRRRIHPVPAAVIRELAPPPPGYVFGYLDGYCVVYDPTTLLIADVIDLATFAR